MRYDHCGTIASSQAFLMTIAQSATSVAELNRSEDGR